MPVGFSRYGRSFIFEGRITSFLSNSSGAGNQVPAGYILRRDQGLSKFAVLDQEWGNVAETRAHPQAPPGTVLSIKRLRFVRLEFVPGTTEGLP